ncbi:P-loop containing nucleoside triphosphate hydrolase protein [Morchella conica CCBAS932]|uniref:P-loop containing nucleoside triphosphate hydrolase protein n=2 Tax=Morchella sect. Distantes TaxID=1051054 RepID=A0A3N4L0K4_9PEZI|nr:P-loop containing nucleoside triphosphate hydrolase protein [Morchella conica CCBAS932]
MSMMAPVSAGRKPHGPCQTISSIIAPQFVPDDQPPQPSPLTPTGGKPSDDFLFVSKDFPYHPRSPVSTFLQHHTGLATDCDMVLRETIKKHHPHLAMTVCADRNCDILTYAALGKVDLKPKDIPFLTQSVFAPSEHRSDGPGAMQVSLDFGCFDVCTKSGHKFIHYYASYVESYQQKAANYFLHDLDSKAAVQELILEACSWAVELHDEILIFQSFWMKDHKLWQAIQKAKWKDVILDEKMKKEIINDVGSFFAGRDTYENLGVPWKRGLIFHGPPGNGKTISIKALMKNLEHPTLYVKSFHTYNGDETGIKMIFEKARAMAPCLLILEDIDSLITKDNRSYFLNEVDGLEENDGILVLATTNHLDLLDPGIVSRPSRFDRKYFFPLPSMDERKAYCKYWKHKLEGSDKIDFPDSLVDKIAEWTEDFSFAYLKEAFVSSLLIIAAREGYGGEDGDEGDEESFETVIKRQIETLKKEMGDGSEQLINAVSSQINPPLDSNPPHKSDPVN